MKGYKRQMTNTTMLATACPELAKEWHPIKNNGLTPENVSVWSKNKAWWQKEYYDSELNTTFIFEWTAQIRSRVLGCGDPFTANKQAWPGYNDLATRNPLVASWWHPTKNGQLTPEQVVATSQQKAWFYQHYHDDFTGKDFDFEWEMPIFTCKNNPYLTGRLVWPGFNDLATRRPDIAKEWDYKRNAPLTPDKIAPKSRKKVWWCIQYVDEKTGKTLELPWQEKVANRVIFNYGCPYFTGQALFRGFNDLATTHPELAKQWHPTKNGKLTPRDVTHGMTRKVWWREDYFSEKHNKMFHFEWPASINHRASGKGNPFVRGLAVWKGFNDLASNYPNLAKEWDYERNGALTPDNITYGVCKKVWWKIHHPHPKTGELVELPWQATIAHRAARGDGCPYLSGTTFPGFNDLATTHPELAAEWHPTKNYNLHPTHLSAGSNKNVWWKACILGKWYEWEAPVYYRVAGFYGIPELKIKSAFEAKIAHILASTNHSYEGEKSFKECKSALVLRYDFFVDKNFLVEADGEQHFKAISLFEGQAGFEKRVANDNKKNAYACTRGIPLLRIPYKYSNNHEKLCKFISYFLETGLVHEEILEFYRSCEFSNYATLFSSESKVVA